MPGRCHAILAIAIIGLGAVFSPAQPFGRFGYSHGLPVDGFRVTHEGFSANHPAADKLKFPGASPIWSIVEVSDQRKAVVLQSGRGAPSKVRVDLTSPGFSLFFEDGLVLQTTSITSPFLTWADGSVQDGIPTPAGKWFALSFSNAQPPLLLGVVGEPTSLIIEGKPGSWRVRSPEFRGWLRVALPMGLSPAATNAPAALGRLAQAVQPMVPLVVQMPPALSATRVHADERSLVVRWLFDRDGVRVPRAFFFAPIGGLPVVMETPLTVLGGTTEAGPMHVVTGREIRMRMIARRIPAGRALGEGDAPFTGLASADPFDVPSVADLALQALSSFSDGQLRELAEQTSSRFLAEATYEVEPMTGQRQPYAPTGAGLDTAGAHALLHQALASSARPTSEGNGLLTSLSWRRDWCTQQLWAENRLAARRASALAAVAGALCPEPERRLEGALFEVGLAAERGEAIWRRRRGKVAGDATIADPLIHLRRVLYYPERAPTPEDAFGRMLLSPFRAYGTTPVRLNRQPEGLELVWRVVDPRESQLTLASSFPFDVAPLRNLASLSASSAFGMTELRFSGERTGEAVARLLLPDWVASLPPAAEPPRFADDLR